MTIDDEKTPIQEFFANQSVFLTGGTGFLGKLLVEKLLRSCPEINRIYILVRTKYNKSAHQRIEELFNDSLFQNLGEIRPKFRDKITAISGDCALPDLGISLDDKSTLIENVGVVFHVAATVKFNENLKLAMQINARGTRDVIGLCKEMRNLKACLHVSTAYSNCVHETIEERFYESPGDFVKLMSLVESADERSIDSFTKDLLGKWPNSYTFTKALAEDLIRKEAIDVPIGVFRPSIVVSTSKEPVSGWIDNKYGPTGIILGGFIGAVRTLHCNGSLKANLVPGDMVVNAMIACAWDVASTKSKNRSGDEIPVYNFVCDESNPLIWDEVKHLSARNIWRIPSIHSIWYYSFRNVKWKALHQFLVIFLHFLPALIMDTMTTVTGQKSRVKLFKIYQKMEKLSVTLSYFMNNEWKFVNDRVEDLRRRMHDEDRKMFFFDVANINWKDYFEDYLLGIRVYLLKDPIESLPRALAKYKRLYWMHQALRAIFAFGLTSIVWLGATKLLFSAARIL